MQDRRREKVYKELTELRAQTPSEPSQGKREIQAAGRQAIQELVKTMHFGSNPRSPPQQK